MASVAALAHGPSPASAARLPPLASPRVHPETRALFAHRARTGKTLPAYRPNATFERMGRLPVVVRFLTTLTQAKRADLGARGVVFDRETPLASGGWLATVTEQGLDVLAADADVARVSVDMFRNAAPPMDKAREETRADIAKRAAIAKDGKRLDGQGTIIADIDTPVFLHHPAFFRADGGAFAWVDVDGDGKLTPGKDGVDLDGSGSIEPAEVLRNLRSTVLGLYSDDPILEHTAFEPDIDYLYLDTNQNGKRDYGKAKGFDEQTPAYGEPLFIFDDANHDRKMEPSERLLQLKTSKFKAVVSSGVEMGRGKKGKSALINYAPEDDKTLAEQFDHATGVSGILAGGTPGLSRWVGFAPEADLLVHDTMSERGQVEAVQWAIDQKADVILTEYAPYTNVSLDGSSEEETILDAATESGAVAVSPAGNLATGSKHRTITLSPGVTKIPVGTGEDCTVAMLSVYYRGAARGLSLALKKPDGTTIDIPASAPRGVELPDGSILYVMSQTTPRNTHESFVNLYAEKGLAKGIYELSATLDAGAPLEVDLFVADEAHAWGGGFTFDENTESRTLCSPSTSDKTISVAAYVLHAERDYYPAGPTAGVLASYSSRGPRIDGVPGIEIGAPDNPISTSSPGKGVDGITWRPFGGTSGAGPHVAAAAALIKQALPNASAEDIKQRILGGARQASEPETAMGKGKLDIARALDVSPPSGAPPVVTIETVGPAVAGAEGRLRVAATDDEPLEGLSARWDLDYDGTFDTEWAPLGEQTIPLAGVAAGATVSAKVEVRDTQGNINGATTLVQVLAEAPAPPPGPAADDGCGCRAAGGPVRARSGLGVLLTLALALVARRARRARVTAARRGAAASS